MLPKSTPLICLAFHFLLSWFNAIPMQPCHSSVTLSSYIEVLINDKLDDFSDINVWRFPWLGALLERVARYANLVARAVQIPRLERVHGGLATGNVQAGAGALAELLVAAVDADDVDGGAGIATRFGLEAGDGGLEAFSGAQHGELLGRETELEEDGGVELPRENV